MKLLDIPVYEMILTDEADGLYCMGLVDEPAIEQNWVLMEKKEPVKLSADNTKHIIFGPALIPDQPIYRRDTGGEYYIVFSKETIAQMVENWSKKGLMNEVNLMHDHDLYTDQCTLVELFLKDTERGLNPANYDDLPDGTLFIAYKVQNPLWGMIESGDLNLNGFSIEAFMEPRRLDETELLADEILNDTELKKKSKLASNNYYTAGQLEDYMDAKKVYDITTKSGKTYNAQIYSITDGGDGIEVMTADKAEGKNTWHNIKISDIAEVKVDPKGIYLPWETDTESYKDYINSPTTVEKTITAPPATIDAMIQQRTVVMINYDDRTNNPNPPEGASHTSARQCAIIARGLTRRGNACIRVYQFFGDSRSIAEGYAERPLGDYRLLLEKRITQLRPLTFAEPWEPDELDTSILNPTGDDGMEIVYTHYSDFM